MRQVRMVQNAERERIERLWLIDDNEVPSPELAGEYEGTLFINAKDSDLLKAIPAKASQHDHIYLVGHQATAQGFSIGTCDGDGQASLI